MPVVTMEQSSIQGPNTGRPLFIRTGTVLAFPPQSDKETNCDGMASELRER
jgi:hypothetical protein